MKRVVAAIAATLMLGCGSGADVDLEQAEIEILGPAGTERLAVLADIATTAPARARGLEGRDSLAEDEGLLLSFPAETEACITNRSVAFPIDAVFFRAEGEVIAVERSLAARAEDVVCHERTVSVLEVAASVARLVQIGDQAVFR